ncbi:MAG TPA: CHAT domain-containing tetratricopeptide repeat protein [Mucilaginibacter sp.]|jgi:CHAT domain-containing protein/tetratricopeptide (TPR) repeat protein
MKFFLKFIIWLCLLVFEANAGTGQCLLDDSLRQEINRIKNERSNLHLKIRELTALKTSYLNCHKKIGPIYAEIIQGFGSCYYLSGNLEEGTAYISEAVTINSYTGKPEPFLCHSYYNLGIIYMQLNFMHKSINCFNNCITAGKPFLEKYFIVGKAHTQLALSFYKAGDYQRAKDIAYKGMFFSNNAKDTFEVGAQWIQIAQAEIELNDLKSAKKHISIALILLNGEDDIRLASIYSVNARFMDAIGKYQTSLLYYRKAFLLNDKRQYFDQCVNDLNDLGYVYDNDLNQEDNARKCYNTALQFAQKNGNNYQIAGLYENLGFTYWRQRNFKKALIFYQKGLNALPINFSDKSITSNPDIATLSQISNDYYVSTLLGDKAKSLLALYKQTADKSLLKAALQTFLLASRSVDMMRWKQLGELSKLHWRNETKQMYENAIEVCYLLNDTENGFYFFEKSRSVLLSDQLNSLLKKNVITDKTQEKRLQSKIDSLNKRLVLLTDSGVNVDKLKTEWLAAHKEWENQQNQLDAKLYEGTDEPDKSAAYIKQQQQQLAINKQSLVEYFSNDSVVYALLITPAKAQIFKITYPSYKHDCSEFLKYCSSATLLNQHYDRYASLASKLYQKLFEPLHIDNERVIISPGDSFISFDALLYDPHSDNSFLLKKYAFSYVYSMQVLMNQHGNTAGQKTVFLGIAPESYPSKIHLAPLIGSVASLGRIQSGFKSYSLLNREDAKKIALLSQIPQSQIVQIYSHAAADSTSRDPVLYMADSAVLMSDIQKVKCNNTDMVVLSACNTGSGYNAVGEGMFSLARGFRLAGIPSTITNLWQADDKATYELTESFYKYLTTGLPKDQALRKAKLDLLNGDKSNSLPFYWAPTIVLGDSSPIHINLSLHNSSFSWLYITFTALIALSGGIYFFASRRRKSVK